MKTQYKHRVLPILQVEVNCVDHSEGFSPKSTFSLSSEDLIYYFDSTGFVDATQTLSTSLDFLKLTQLRIA